MNHSAFSGTVILWLVLIGCYYKVLCESDGDVNDVNNQTANQSCYIPNVSSNETAWKLIWQDSFDSANKLRDTDWAVQHEPDVCEAMESCNVMHNVRLIDGMLVLMAQTEKYNGRQYTSANVTTKRYFTYGRWEFRLAQPVGKYFQTTIYIQNHYETYWHEFGQIVLSTYIQTKKVYRGTPFSNRRGIFQPMNLLINASVPMHDFHLYGLEWDSTGVRFFLDDQYSKTVAFDHALRGISPQQKIRLRIRVGGPMLIKPMSPELQSWKCPVMIVDYVRIYEKIPVVVTFGLEECKDISTNDSKLIVDDICRRALGHGIFEIWLSVIIILILFLGLLTYMIIYIYKAKKTAKKEGGHNDDTNEYQENVYETVNEVDPHAESSNINSMIRSGQLA